MKIPEKENLYTEEEVRQYIWWSWQYLDKEIREDSVRLLKREEMEAWWQENKYH